MGECVHGWKREVNVSFTVCAVCCVVCHTTLIASLRLHIHIARVYVHAQRVGCVLEAYMWKLYSTHYIPTNVHRTHTLAGSKHFLSLSLSFPCRNPHWFLRLLCRRRRRYCCCCRCLFYVLTSILILFEKPPTSVQFFLSLALLL